MKSPVIPALLLFLAAASLGCPQGGTLGRPDVIKIVSSLPRTGSANAQTGTIVNGIRMAIEERDGKVAGFTIEYEDWDDASAQRGNWDPALEAANADRAVKDPDVMVYIGTYNSGAAKVSIPVLNRAGLVMISPANTYPGLTKPGAGEANEPEIYRPSGRVNYFRVVPTDDLQGSVAADWAKSMGVRKAFVIHDRELYGKGIADIFEKRARELGIEIVGYEGIDSKASNYKALATKIRAGAADLVYFGGTTQSNAGQLAKDVLGSGYEGNLMVPDGCVELAFIESAGPDMLEDRTYATFGGLPATQLTGKGAEFLARYRERYGSDPEVYAVYGYEAAAAALTAIERAGKKDRAAILGAVAGIRDFDGALGRWSFDENGDTSLRTMSGQVVRAGTFEFLTVLGS
jgi:branched-chain amino acid transport system substrate-binding protein